MPPDLARISTRSVMLLVVLLPATHIFAQSAPASPDRPWHSTREQEVQSDAKNLDAYTFRIDSGKTYSLPELIDLAEAHNPQTRVAWESACAQAAALGIARSELYPTLAAVAVSQLNRDEVLFGTTFFSQTVEASQVGFDLNYTVLDFGARAGRIARARADVLAANFGFNDAHRSVIYQVEQAYYQLLNASGQEGAVRASLSNAQAVQEAAEARLKQGLATLPDVLEARSATAQAAYELQAVLGAEETARGDLATALGISPTVTIHIEPLEVLPIPEGLDDSVDQAIQKAFQQRPDLLERVAEVRAANAGVKEAHAAFYPTLSLSTSPDTQLLYGSQQALPWTHTAGFYGGLSATLSWTLFDGGARKNRVAQAQADVRGAQAQAAATRDQVADQVWTAYSNLQTAFRQRQAATALLEAASQSYAASLEAYKYGVRNLLDVTAAQQTLAQARSADVLARTQVLGARADLAFRTGEAIQAGARLP